MENDHRKRTRVFPVTQYDLGGTLSSGQAFRWRPSAGRWEGVIGCHWLRLCEEPGVIRAEVTEPVDDWEWLIEYLQLGVDLEKIVARFPSDPPMRAAANACLGLRLLRQDPWECLASFILSSTKQIVQIQRIIARVCERFGEEIPAGNTAGFAHAFPSAAILAEASETELRECKMGFRAPNLKATAIAVATRRIDLVALRAVPVEAARGQLMGLPGVGRKIADCVLLFSYGFQEAFPVDVWVMKALRQLYFPKRCVTLRKLQEFASSHFRPYSGYAQQYLFHYARVHGRRRP